MPEFQIERAERKQAKARIALSGVSGSGKTYSALLLAKGLVEYMLENKLLHGGLQGKIGLVDTERRSGSLYAHLFDYDVINLDAPFTSTRYIAAINAFANAGYQAIIVDSATHQWAGKGGVLDQVSDLQKRATNQFAAWGDIKPDEEEFWETILECSAHIFVTMRSKSAYILSETIGSNGRAKVSPQKVGMKPIQREGVDFEFTSVLDLETVTHRATAAKDRTELFKESFVPSPEWGHRLGHWLLSGAESTMLAPTATPLERLYAAAGVATRAVDRAKTLPDLVRSFEEGVSDIRAIKDALADSDKATVRQEVDKLIQAKDMRKKQLTPAVAAMPSDPISIEDAAELEQTCLAKLGNTDTFLEKYRIQRFAQLAEQDLPAAKDWLRAGGDAVQKLINMQDDMP